MYSISGMMHSNICATTAIDIGGIVYKNAGVMTHVDIRMSAYAAICVKARTNARNNNLT